MGKTFCYWTVADGKHGQMAATMVASARQVGVTADFHIWTDTLSIDGANVHPCGTFDKTLYMFKFHFLRNEVSKLDYDYFVFLDADNYFVKNPGDLAEMMGSDKVFVQMENDCSPYRSKRGDWWSCPIGEYGKFLSEQGAKSDIYYNTNAGFWIVAKTAIAEFYERTTKFFEAAHKRGYRGFTEEPALAFVGHIMQDPKKRVFEDTSWLWASDWTGQWKDKIPEYREWQFEDYMSGEKKMVKPCIVHAMRSKEKMIQQHVDVMAKNKAQKDIAEKNKAPIKLDFDKDDTSNYFRMPNEVCVFDTLPPNDYRGSGISDRNTYLRLCEYYDKFKVKFFEYSTSNWVPKKEKYDINFGVHYQCYKQKRATYECLADFRRFYPDVPIVLISDNGDDFTDIATYFKCTYIHETTQSGNGITNVLKGDIKANTWLNRIKRTCELLTTVDYILYLEDDVITRDYISKNPNADIAGPSNPDDFRWSPQLISWLKTNRPDVEVNGLNGCGGTIFKRESMIKCFDNMPNFSEIGKHDDRLTWASDVMLTFLFMYNGFTSRRWLDQSEEPRGKNFGSTAFDHQNKHFYDKKWSPFYMSNLHLDNNKDFIFTACSDNIFKDQFIPFFASLRENTKFNQTIIVIDYGINDENMKFLIDNGIRVIPSYGKYEIVSDRFISINRYIQGQSVEGKIFCHYDCDVWFNKDISHIFELSRQKQSVLCTKDVWHCGFLHDCVSKEEHKEYNRNILFEVERRCGKVLQAGFVCGDSVFWKTYAEYLEKLLLNGYLKNSFGSDELVLNLMYFYKESIFHIMPIGYNTLPQWNIKDYDNTLYATDFHTDSVLGKIPNHREEVIAVHLSSAARNKKEFEHTDFKVKCAVKYQSYLKKLVNASPFQEKEDAIIQFGYRHLFPKLLDATNSKVICEVGVQWGNNLFNMVHNSNVSEAYGVDIWRNTENKAENDIGLSQEEQEKIYKHVTSVADSSNNRIKIIRDYSYIACDKFTDKYFDLVYIDGDHSYEGCLRDMMCWWNKVKDGGILSGDDYVLATTSVGVKFGVIQAVNEFVSKYNLRGCFFNTAGKDNKGSSPQWFIIKK
jgi:hypothetical protein